MKPVNRNPERNQQLVAERGISFEDVVFYLQQGALLDDVEADKFKSVLTPERRRMLQEAAEETFKKDKRINIRISSRDLELLQRRAAEFNVMRYSAHRSRILDFCHVTHYICVHDQDVRGQAHQVLV
ncbi:MAG: hypothetical protein RI993_1568 [Pseudomonadota bacterium]|jgi:predicted DNA binding CopG/RHH family protein